MMRDNIPACFRCGGAAGGPPRSTAAGPSLTTSIYETRLGLVALTWSRTVVGLSLRAELRLSAPGDNREKDDAEEGEEEEEPLRFHVRPWLFWMRRGSKKFHLKDRCRLRSLDIAWDLRRASFPPSGGPEPAAGFYVAIAVDAETLVVAGDLADQWCKKIEAKRTSAQFSKPVLISRREHVALGDSAASGGSVRRCYRTSARFGGRERELSIELTSREKERDSAAMSVCVDGERVLHVRRLRWKFRGSEKVELDGAGSRIQVSWDLHDWLFKPTTEAAPSAGVAAAALSEPDPGHAVFIFRFEPKEGKQEQGHSGNGLGGYFGNGQMNKDVMLGYFGKNRNWSESSSGGNAEGRSRRRRQKSLRKTNSSSSSTSSASSSSSSTVMDWASQEEVELQRAEGFSLLVYLWKS